MVGRRALLERMVFADNDLSGGMCFGSRYGIECNEFGFVRSISLSDNRLRGSVPSSISYLIYLEVKS